MATLPDSTRRKFKPFTTSAAAVAVGANVLAGYRPDKFNFLLNRNQLLSNDSYN